MTTDTRRLHDKATRGEALSAEEHAHLEQWYARLDDEESASFASASSPEQLDALRAEVNAARARLVAATQRIQALAAENEAARSEVAALQQRLVERTTAQPA
jgi:predicted  nucleic acid-binding Zn-ribbon protein